MPSGKDEIFNLLIEQENLLGQLYTIYRDIFPELADFWGQLVTEEKAHADVLAELSKSIDDKTVFFDQRKFTALGLSASIEYIRKQLQTATIRRLTLLKALSTAFDLETTLIEKEFFNVVVSDTLRIKTEFGKLRERTQEHVRRVAARLGTERARSAS